MMRIILAFLVIIFSISKTAAQSNSIDRNKVLDYFQNQQYDDAINYLSFDAGSDSTNIQRLSFLGYAYYMNDNYKAASKYYQQMISIDSNNLTANTYLENIYNNSHPAQAEIFASRLIRLQPGKAANYRIMGSLMLGKNLKDSALSYFNRAYGLAPYDYKNGAALAELLVDKKLYKTADSIVNVGLIKDSLNVSFLKLRIRSAYESSDYRSALIPGERLMRIGEIAVNPLLQVVLSYYNSKMYLDCIRVCEYMLVNEITIESVYYYEAKAWAKLKEYSKSNELLQVCLSKAISKTAEMYYYNLGQNYESLHQYNKAVIQYDTAYYLFKDPIMNYNSGSIYETGLKDPRLAKKYFTKYLALAKPKSTDERKAYEYVRSRWGINRKVTTKAKK